MPMPTKPSRVLVVADLKKPNYFRTLAFEERKQFECLFKSKLVFAIRFTYRMKSYQSSTTKRLFSALASMTYYITHTARVSSIDDVDCDALARFVSL